SSDHGRDREPGPALRASGRHRVDLDPASASNDVAAVVEAPEECACCPRSNRRRTSHGPCSRRSAAVGTAEHRQTLFPATAEGANPTALHPTWWRNQDGRRGSDRPMSEKTTPRQLLDYLARSTLVRLIYQRGLPTSRENDERRSTLARSYRGDVEALVSDLNRQELIMLFDELNFFVDGEWVYLSNPGKYRLEDLRAFAIAGFANRPVPIPGEFTRVDDENEEDEDDDEGE